jgi:hypothetical protein
MQELDSVDTSFSTPMQTKRLGYECISNLPTEESIYMPQS